MVFHFLFLVEPLSREEEELKLTRIEEHNGHQVASFLTLTNCSSTLVFSLWYWHCAVFSVPHCPLFLQLWKARGGLWPLYSEDDPATVSKVVH